VSSTSIGSEEIIGNATGVASILSLGSCDRPSVSEPGGGDCKGGIVNSGVNGAGLVSSTSNEAKGVTIGTGGTSVNTTASIVACGHCEAETGSIVAPGGKIGMVGSPVSMNAWIVSCGVSDGIIGSIDEICVSTGPDGSSVAISDSIVS